MASQAAHVLRAGSGEFRSGDRTTGVVSDEVRLVVRGADLGKTRRRVLAFAQMPLNGPELQDRGLHLRGIVQMMAVDRVLDAAQRAHIQAWAAEHGFDPAYVDASIDSVFENQHFLTDPPRFSSRPAAEAFVREAALVAFSDGEFHPQEREWLLGAAKVNGIDAQAVLQVIEESPHGAGSSQV